MSDADTLARPALLPAPVHLPQRADLKNSWIEHIEVAATSLREAALPGWRRRRLEQIVALTRVHQDRIGKATDKDIRIELNELRRLLRRSGMCIELVARGFAMIREVAGRTLGLRHFDVQLIGGYAILEGMIAEMETGEGKTLTATLAAGVAALAGIPVHVVTVNDYLAERDAKVMSPLYRALGLTVGVIVHGKQGPERQRAYACDITYATNKEVAFDYLRDRIVLGKRSENLRLKLEALQGDSGRLKQIVMRGLHFAIVDEADSVLVDEARTPLIISGESKDHDDRRWTDEALGLARRLVVDEDYRVFLDERRVELTAEGRDRLESLGQELGGLWCSRIRREESLHQALTAMFLFENGIQYIVRDGKIQIVDEYTGRIMEDRSWNEGLHQLIEAKEGCEVTERKSPLARISYQRFFRRYHKLGGMTGTAREVRKELWAVYRLAVVSVPTNRPVRRTDLPPVICRSADEKLRVIATQAAAMQAEGRPVLIGTRSVAASESLSRQLAEAGLAHVVLNAAQDEDEAEIISEAGTAGRITVATNMAGRGVDIGLGDEVAQRGGLHVILSERHDAGRIDRQLIGRCGRQGEPGTTQAILSLDDPLLDVLRWQYPRRLAKRAEWKSTQLWRLLFDSAQRRAERLHSRIRRQLLRSDEKTGTLLAFAGELE